MYIEREQERDRSPRKSIGKGKGPIMEPVGHCHLNRGWETLKKAEQTWQGREVRGKPGANVGRNPGRETMFRSRKETGYQTFQRKVKARKQLLGLTTRAYFQYGDRCGCQLASWGVGIGIFIQRHWVWSRFRPSQYCASANGGRGLSAKTVCQLPCPKRKQIICRKRQASCKRYPWTW